MAGKTFFVSEYPKDLEKKVTLLRHFKSYMQDNLSKDSASEGGDSHHHRFTDQGVVALRKWLRTKHAMFFRLSNSVVQINFFDHSKMVLSNGGLSVLYINKSRVSRSLFLPTDLQHHPEKADILTRLKYAKEIMEELTQKKQQA